MATEEPTPREAARVLIFDSEDRLLLLRGHDPYLPERSWWFTPGGGLHDGETARDAAAREAVEETGIRFAPESLVGPVWERTAVFDFMHSPYAQHEEFYVAHLADATERRRIVWTEAERDTLEAAEWHTVDQIRAFWIEVFPNNLADLLATVMPWNGELRHLGIETS